MNEGFRQLACRAGEDEGSAVTVESLERIVVHTVAISPAKEKLGVPTISMKT